MRPSNIPTPLAALLLATTLGGCISIHDPDTNNPTPHHANDRHQRSSRRSGEPRAGQGTRRQHPRRRPRAHRARSPPTPRSSTPQAALERYGTLWCNWTAATVVSRSAAARVDLARPGPRRKRWQAAASLGRGQHTAPAAR